MLVAVVVVVVVVIEVLCAWFISTRIHFARGGGRLGGVGGGGGCHSHTALLFSSDVSHRK